MARYRQVHDLWHVLYGLPPTMLGEVALKWLEAAQTGLPMAAMAAGGGSLRLKPAERSIVAQHVLPWAASTLLGGASTGGVDLMCVYYEHEFGRPLAAVREELRIRPCPMVSVM